MGNSLKERAFQIINEAKEIGIGHIATKCEPNGQKKSVIINGQKSRSFFFERLFDAHA